MATVHIIGAGVSGLAAATQLAAAHVPVKLYEATSTAGGRARSSHDAALGSIDHGLHLVGPDRTELDRYLARIQTSDRLKRIRNPLRLPRAPLVDYIQLIPNLWQRHGHADQLSTDSHLREHWAKRVARLVLHTPLEELSSAALRRALWRMLKPNAGYAMFDGLGASLVAPALMHLDYHGGSVYFSHALKQLEWNTGQPGNLTFARKKVPLQPDDVVIFATPPAFTHAMLPGIQAPHDNHSAITLHYQLDHTYAEGVLAPDNAPVDLVRYQPGRISATIRVADHAWHGDTELLGIRIWQWLQRMHPTLRATPFPPYAIWREKRAGHRLTPENTPSIGATPPRIFVAGDWTTPHAPASLEVAIASGHRAADAALALIGPYALRHQ